MLCSLAVPTDDKESDVMFHPQASRQAVSRLIFPTGGRRVLTQSGTGWVLLALLLLGLAGCTTLSESGNNPIESKAYGIWTGRLPCMGCAGIDTRLVLWRNPDFFRLTETYLDTGGGPKTFTSFGRWDLEKVGKTPELGRLSLTTDDARRTVYLERLPNGSLRLLDHNGDVSEPAEDYTLERTRAQVE